MSPRPSTNGWVPPVVRVAAVGLAAAGLVVGAGRVGEVSTGTAAPPTAARVAATQSTSYCTGDPFAGGEDETPTVDVAGSVTAVIRSMGLNHAGSPPCELMGRFGWPGL